MSNLEDFFAAPRKAKTSEAKIISSISHDELNLEESIKNESEPLIEKVEELSTEIEEIQTKNRYQAIPKKRVERKYDTFVNKRAQLNEEDFLFLNSLEKSVSFARKKLNIDPSINRVTSNTFIRLVIEQFSAKAQEYIDNHPNIHEKLQTDEEIRNWIKKIQ